MKVNIQNYFYIYKHGRNILCASLFDGEQPLKTDELSNLLRYIEAEKLELVNAHQVLREIVLTHGFTI